MEKKNDGGPAFPVNDSTISGEPGMTLRDYFAAKAMTGYMASQISTDDETGMTLVEEAYGIANWAYRVADAMLKARGE